MEGAMQERKRKRSDRYGLRELQFLSNLGTYTEEGGGDEDIRESEDEEELYEPPRRSNRNQWRKKTCNEARNWANFPVDMLDTISQKLAISDFLNIGKVCRSWRMSLSAFKHSYISAQAPLVMQISTRAKKLCHFYDMSTHFRYGTKLPTLVRNICLGCSGGYLILQDYHNDLLVINPVTGHQLRFPNMPQHNNSFYLHDRATAIFASFGSDSDFVVMVFSKTHQNVRYCISRDTTSWGYQSFSNRTEMVLELAVFSGRIYALTNEARIGYFNLRTHSFLFMPLVGNPNLSNYARLVGSKKQLLAVDFMQPLRVRVYKIDLETMKWAETEDLGDEALFIDDWKCSKLGSKSNWRGWLKNCVYHLSSDNLCYVCNLNRELRHIFPISLPRGNTKIKCWYFLQEAYSLDNINNE